MKYQKSKFFSMLCLVFAMCSLLMCPGCVTQQKDPSNPNDLGTWSANVPAISNAVAKVQQLNQAFTPQPYQPLTAEAIAGIGALATAISGGIAFLKNKKANRLKQVNTSLAIAVKQGQPAGVLLSDAAHSPHFADLASALSSAPPVNPNHPPG